MKKIPTDFRAKKILILGLGGGGMIKYLIKRFPHGEISVIEWDEAMVKAARENSIADLTKVKIILGDASQEIEKLKTKFDLVAFDLFTSDDISNVVRDGHFISKISEILNPAGLLLANLFLTPEPTKVIEKYLSEIKVWRFKTFFLDFHNYLGLYRNKNFQILPKGYITFKSSPSFLKREYKDEKTKIAIGGEAIGYSWRVGPIIFERYEGDIEPTPRADSNFKFIIWQPTARRDKPNGWRRSWDQIGNKRSGFAEITSPENYWHDWDAHALRHRNKWMRVKTNKWQITEVSLNDFTDAYKRIQKKTYLIDITISQLERSARRQGNNLRLFAAKAQDGIIHAGFAAVDIPEENQSYHLTSFHDQEAKRDSVGTGLIDEWFKNSIQHNLRFLDFWVFWSPGENRSWRGFSKFKAQFATNFIDYPKPLLKFIKAKKG